ncbi:MAG: hypothetical protein V2A54_13635 [Bacteroidota bacterium]
MKKIFFTLFVLVATTIGTVSAQKYFVYDGSPFSIMMTCNNENTTITSVEYTFENKWVPFTVNSQLEMFEDEDGEGGYIFIVADASGNSYTIDYFRTSDYCIVTNDKTNASWTLKRRAEGN